MSDLGLVITLLEPVVLPVQAATATRPQSLSYLPGATLLGLAAAALYDRLGASLAFTAFHSGSVRFGDGFPVSDTGHLCLPVPMSLHAPKHAPKGARPDRATDPALCDFAATDSVQAFKQLRDQDIVLDGTARFHKPRMETSMRTAIAFETGLADERQFFGYEALSPGQRFRTRLSGNDTDLLEKIKTALIGQEHFIGRSKSAEFGRVRIELDDTGPWGIPAGPDTGSRRFVWLLSDTWFADATGHPTTRPSGASFGMGSGEVDWAHSYVRARSVSPYNAAWGQRSGERWLITRGSVLTLTGQAPPTGLHVFGMGQEAGLGLAYVSAEPLGELLAKPLAPLPAPPSKPPEPAGATDFLRWTRAKRDRAQGRVTGAQAAEAELAKLRAHYTSAKRLAGEPVGPTPSQWAGLATRLAGDIPPEQLLGIEGDRDRTLWGARYATGAGVAGTFRGFVNAMLADEDGVDRLRNLARKARRAIEAEGWLDPGAQDTRKARDGD